MDKLQFLVLIACIAERSNPEIRHDTIRRGIILHGREQNLTQRQRRQKIVLPGPLKWSESNIGDNCKYAIQALTQTAVLGHTVNGLSTRLKPKGKKLFFEKLKTRKRRKGK